MPIKAESPNINAHNEPLMSQQTMKVKNEVGIEKNDLPAKGKSVHNSQTIEGETPADL